MADCLWQWQFLVPLAVYIGLLAWDRVIGMWKMNKKWNNWFYFRLLFVKDEYLTILFKLTVQVRKAKETEEKEPYMAMIADKVGGTTLWC